MKKLSQEITQKYVREIVKELTKRALHKRIHSLNDEKIKKLEYKLKLSSDEKKINKFKGSRDEISKLISQDGITDTEFVDNANSFFETKIHQWIKLSPEITLPITTKSILIILAIASVLFIAFLIQDEVLPNQKPIAQIKPQLIDSFVGTPIIFESTSKDLDTGDYIAGYKWHIDGNLLDISDNIIETDLPAGKHEIQLMVKDSHDLWSEPVTAYLEVQANSPPTAEIVSIVPGTRVPYGTFITLVGSGIEYDAGDYIAGYKWHIDGNLLDISENFIETDLPAGKHEIQLMVKDSHDLWSEPVTAYLEVQANSPPTAEIVSIVPGTRVPYGTSITLVGSGIEYDAGEYIRGFEWQIDDQVAGTENVLNIKSLPLGTYTVRFRVENNHGIKSEFVEETIIVSLEYVIFNVYSETGLIVENGLCADGNKNCEENGNILGGGYYAKLGEKVALNGNSTVLADLLLEEEFTEYHTLSRGEVIDLHSGYSLSVQEINIKGNDVLFSLTQDGERIFEPVVKTGNLFIFMEENLGDESDVPVIVFYVDTVFAGMTNNYVRISGIWMISTDV
ncbi:MAG: hypothetical protein KAR85_07795 [Methanosarcinales archaeon]|nr:hypothetical protein [Methanosarcinales archaeon]